MVESGADCCCRFCILICLLPIPPLAVMCHRGCDNNVWINVVFTCLLYFPGVIHAIYVIATKPPADASGRTTVVNVVNNNSANAGR